MFKDIKSKTKSFLSKLFMTVFALSFLSWGANSYFMNTPKSIAMTINGEEVPVSELQKEYESRKTEAERQFGGKLSDEFLQTIQLGNRTVNNIITSKLTLAQAKELGFRASSKALENHIKNNPSFKDAEGKFNKEAYTRNVQSYGYSVRGYENLISAEMQKENLFDMFSTNFNNKKYLENLYNFQNEKISVRVLHVNKDAVPEVSAPTVSEIKSFYDENMHRFQTEETRDFNVLVLRASDLKDRVQISEAEALEIYNDNPESFASLEERQARHILVDSEEKAIELIDQLDKGADFAALAKANSKDAFTKKVGGDLGFFREADMVESFSDAAFSMEIGEISEPVKSPFGYHVIQLNAVKEAKLRTFEEVKLDIEAELRTEKSEDLFYDVLENVQDQIAGGSPLADIAKSSNLNLDSYAQVKQNSTSMTFSTDIMPVVYALEENIVSNEVEIDGQDAVTAFVEVTKITAPRALTIDEARARIVTELNEIALQKAMTQKAENLMVERQNTPSLEALAKKHNISNNVEVLSGIGRTGTSTPKWLKPQQVSLLFAMKAGEELNSVINTPEGVALVELISINADNATDEDLAYFQQKVSKDIQSDLFAQYMLQKRQEASIDLNVQSIEFALGSGYVK
tara:strand:+ start:168674 stop:170566 length:1893 start_codon:yes stop_codon:yes gene_type:complete